MKRFARVILTAISSIFIALQLVGMPLRSQQDTGSGLQVSPATNPIEMIPGQTKDIKISVKNPTGNEIIVSPVVYDFKSDGVTGSAILDTDPDSSGVRSIKSYINGLEDVPLGIGESYEYNLSVTLPEQIIPGAYYGAVTFRAVPVGADGLGSTSAVSLNASVASLVLIDVLGDAETSGVIEEVYAAKLKDQDGLLDGNNIGSGYIFTRVPDAIAVKIKNSGDTFLEPLGVVTVKNMFGDSVEYNFNGAIVPGTLLPDSTRTFVDAIDNLGGFGRFTVEGGIGLVDGGETTDIKITFWVIPVWMWLVLGVMSTSLIAGAYLAYRRIKG